MLGETYLEASVVLQVLLLGTFVVPLTCGLESLVYAYGRYGLVTVLGVLSNLPRVLLYRPLVTYFGEVGAALSYISGYFSALVGTVLLSRRIYYRMEWDGAVKAFPVALAVAFVSSALGLHWILGTTAVLATCLVAYARLGLVIRQDLREVSEVFLTKRQIELAYPYVKHLLSVLYKDSD